MIPFYYKDSEAYEIIIASSRDNFNYLTNKEQGNIYGKY